MFGITPLGWLHTLGSLPAIPAAGYMLFRYGRIVPRSIAGRVYFICMVIGGLTVFLVAKAPETAAVGAVTLLVLLAGYTVGRIQVLGRVRWYLETFLLTLTVFLLMVPTVSEILRRVPDGHPIAADPGSPILKGALASLVAMLVLGLAAQFIYLFKFKVSKRAR
ncbi:hypothetical protein [Manganibacter manganicus]|uniref:DUF2306 domain-containing protein n=1 Tax=Manganibacter manganicus TaxID=1873176 RepID=A0A1V8RPQ7_9HYPH|nr:hypothetical protein [Pseudaminobacter manganicus]OQM75191.1 hypothetical protein BFN67_19450 [Pseudaminobacter manganicus]